MLMERVFAVHLQGEGGVPDAQQQSGRMQLAGKHRGRSRAPPKGDAPAKYCLSAYRAV